MGKKKGVKCNPDPLSIRRVGVRLSPVRPEYAKLLDAIATIRGGTKSSHIEKALLLYANLEEKEASGLVDG